MAKRASEELSAELDAFRARFVRVACSAAGVVCLPLCVSAIIGGVLPLIASTVVILIAVGIVLAINRAGQSYRAAQVMIAAVCLATVAGSQHLAIEMPANVAGIYMLAIVLASWLLGGQEAVAAGVVGLVVVGVGGARTYAAGLVPDDMAGQALGTPIALLLVLTVCVVLFSRRTRATTLALERRVDALEQVAASAERIAEGELAPPETDDASEALQGMHDMAARLRDVVAAVQSSATSLAGAAAQLSMVAEVDQRDVARQAVALDQVRTLVGEVVTAARSIVTSTEEVTQVVRSTRDANALIAEQTDRLLAHTDRVSELLDVIKDVARKSNILALNAAIEGTRAGEHGRGFKLVANRMQGLAAAAADSLKDVKVIVSDVSTAAQATREVIGEGAARADVANHQAASIRAATSKQLEALEDLQAAIEDIHRIAQSLSERSGHTLDAARDVSDTATELEASVGHFRT